MDRSYQDQSSIEFTYTYLDADGEPLDLAGAVITLQLTGPDSRVREEDGSLDGPGRVKTTHKVDGAGWWYWQFRAVTPDNQEHWSLERIFYVEANQS